jgi:hypothetical protein
MIPLVGIGTALLSLPMPKRKPFSKRLADLSQTGMD